MTIAKWIEHTVNIIDKNHSIRMPCGANYQATQQYSRNRDEYWKTVMTMVEKY